jgi:hypothetical protein
MKRPIYLDARERDLARRVCEFAAEKLESFARFVVDTECLSGSPQPERDRDLVDEVQALAAKFAESESKEAGI